MSALYSAVLITALAPAPTTAPLAETAHASSIPDSAASPPRHHALKLGVGIALFGGPHVAVGYERSITNRLSIIHALGGRHFTSPLQTITYNPSLGYYVAEVYGQRTYTSVLLSTQLRYYVLPRKHPFSGLYTAAGIGFTYEQFGTEYSATSGQAEQAIDIHTPFSFRVGSQFCIRKRLLIDLALGADLSADNDAPNDPYRQWAFATALLLSSTRHLQIGYRF